MILKVDALGIIEKFIKECPVRAKHLEHREQVRQEARQILSMCQSTEGDPEAALAALRALERSANDEGDADVRSRAEESKVVCQALVGRSCVVNMRLGVVCGVTKNGRLMVKFSDGHKPVHLNGLHPTSAQIIEEQVSETSDHPAD